LVAEQRERRGFDAIGLVGGEQPGLEAAAR